MVVDTSAILAIIFDEIDVRLPLLFKGNDFAQTDIQAA